MVSGIELGVLEKSWELILRYKRGMVEEREAKSGDYEVAAEDGVADQER